MSEEKKPLATKGQRVRCVSESFRFAPPWQELPTVDQELTVKYSLEHPSIPEIVGYAFEEFPPHETLGDPMFDVLAFELIEDTKH